MRNASSSRAQKPCEKRCSTVFSARRTVGELADDANRLTQRFPLTYGLRGCRAEEGWEHPAAMCANPQVVTARVPPGPDDQHEHDHDEVGTDIKKTSQWIYDMRPLRLISEAIRLRAILASRPDPSTAKTPVSYRLLIEISGNPRRCRAQPDSRETTRSAAVVRRRSRALRGLCGAA